eukprot:Pgem_evm1s15495
MKSFIWFCTFVQVLLSYKFVLCSGKDIQVFNYTSDELSKIESVCGHSKSECMAPNPFHIQFNPGNKL